MTSERQWRTWVQIIKVEKLLNRQWWVDDESDALSRDHSSRLGKREFANYANTYQLLGSKVIWSCRPTWFYDEGVGVWRWEQHPHPMTLTLDQSRDIEVKLRISSKDERCSDWGAPYDYEWENDASYSPFKMLSDFFLYLSALSSKRQHKIPSIRNSRALHLTMLENLFQCSSNW